MILNKKKRIQRTFINAKMIKEEGEEWSFNEGCLSIPDVREDVYRNPQLQLNTVRILYKTEVLTD
jgi:peptide deformylase